MRECERLLADDSIEKEYTHFKIDELKSLLLKKIKKEEKHKFEKVVGKIVEKKIETIRYRQYFNKDYYEIKDNNNEILYYEYKGKILYTSQELDQEMLKSKEDLEYEKNQEEIVKNKRKKRSR